MKKNAVIIGSFIYIVMELYFPRDVNLSTSRWEKTSNNNGVFFIPGFHLHDGIPSVCSHPGVAELMVYHEFSTTSNF